MQLSLKQMKNVLDVLTRICFLIIVATISDTTISRVEGGTVRVHFMDTNLTLSRVAQKEINQPKSDFSKYYILTRFAKFVRLQLWTTASF